MCEKDCPLTLEEAREMAARGMNAITVGTPLGTPAFNAGARHYPGIAFEAVLFRRGEGRRLEVYLTKRTENEAYPNLWHCPGTFVRSGEMPDDVFQRLSKKELGGVEISEHELAGQEFFNNEERFPTMLDMVYLIRMETEPTAHNGQWWPVDALPDNIVAGHRTFVIPTAMKAFKNKEHRDRRETARSNKGMENYFRAAIADDESELLAFLADQGYPNKQP